MNLLAVDTATGSCGVSVLCSDGRQAHCRIESGRTHARHLLTLINQTLAACDARLNEMDGFAVTRGPGSFTGLRIGISTVKGLAAAWDRPLAGISSLEALAAPFENYPGLICTMIDARKGQVYACRYKNQASGLRAVTSETAQDPETAAEIDCPCLFVGTGAVAYQDRIIAVAGERAMFARPWQHAIQPEVVASLGRQRLQAGQDDDPAGFAPVYIRPPDAVINRG